MKKLITTVALAACCVACNAGVVADVIILEACGEGKAGMDGVASVIYWRSVQRHLTPEEVVLQPKQFSCVNNINLSEAHNKAIRIGKNQVSYAIELENKLRSGTFKPTVMAMYYHTINGRHDWASNKKIVAIIRNHVFFNL